MCASRHCAHINVGVEHVVCVRRDERVMDKASMTFARSFYHALFTGRRNVRAAFHIAQVQYAYGCRNSPVLCTCKEFGGANAITINLELTRLTLHGWCITLVRSFCLALFAGAGRGMCALLSG